MSDLVIIPIIFSLRQFNSLWTTSRVLVRGLTSIKGFLEENLYSRLPFQFSQRFQPSFIKEYGYKDSQFM